MTPTALILAGGVGSRLRPLSSDENPKQFLRIFDGASLLEKTFARVTRLVEPPSIFISTNEQYAPKCAAHLPRLPEVNILTEPARRNTAPAIAVCCFAIESVIGDAVIAVLASDSYIADEDEFVRVLACAYDFAAASDYLVTIGIEPTEANTGYGYLQLGAEIDFAGVGGRESGVGDSPVAAPASRSPGVGSRESSVGDREPRPASGETPTPDPRPPTPILRVDRFHEKPSRERAEEFLRAGNYAWNAGMFVWRVSVFRRALETAAPEIASLADRIVTSGDPARRVEHYEAMPSISIDYALMEKAPRVAALRGNFGWSDVGSFESLERAGVPVAELLKKAAST
ncbi:MAG TPA: mannose-1-phosphate guanylyltransferase [Thermoanaerobaculia bacterium]|jgi:mannose-1-phosphate guanylyltransferase|nr:mannose-1-phosphate guanylyltransferase [Thermoanaerobaculia bacterium]